MDCKACGAANPETHRFCESCGAGLVLRCKLCDFAIKPGARFCGGCGTALVAAPPVAWGELKQATVLFADIVSSTEQIADLDPEEAMDRLQPAVMVMCQAVERFGGTVMRTLGDGVMALFGVPKSLEGHAVLACEAALEMQRAFAGHPQGLSIRVGLHSGLVASDPYAPDGGKGGGAHGMTIHLASRVVGLAAPDGVTLTQDCLELVRQAVEATSLGLKPLKGVPKPVEIFTLDKLKPAFASQRFRQGSLTALRGRERELILLQQTQRRAEAGMAGVVGIGGAPGTGKSRLCFEFAQWCRSRQVPVYEVRAQLYGHATPYQTALELIRGFVFGLTGSGDTELAHQQVRDVMQAAGLDGATDLALMLDFLGILAGGPAPEQLPPRARRARFQEIVGTLFRHAGGQHAIIIAEDLHWLDDASAEFFATLLGVIGETHVALIMNYRSPYEPAWMQGREVQRIELTELSDADANAMVRELISHRRELTDIYQLIVKRSGGNPFFAEELVRSLAESGALTGEPGIDRGSFDSIDRSLPSTVHAVIGARIDRVAEGDKGVLQVCAIVGKEVPFAVLAQVAAREQPELEQSLGRLCTAELLHSMTVGAERTYAFRHPLIQEVAYGSQLKARRATLHALVADAMGGFYGDRLGEFAALIAYHYEAAGQFLQAARHEGMAAQWVGSTGSARAIQHWQKVRSLLHGRPPLRESDKLRAMACSKIVLLGWREGLKFDELSACLNEAMQLAPEVDSRLTQLLLFLDGRMLQANGGAADEYVNRVMRALGMVDATADPGRAATLHAALGQACAWAGELPRSLAATDHALQNIEKIDEFDREFFGFSIHEWVLGIRARVLMRMGRVDEAQACLQTLLSGPASADPVISQIAHFGYVELARERMDKALAAAHANKADEIARSNPSPYLQMVAFYCGGVSCFVAGKFGEAAQIFDKALSVVRSANVAIEFETEILACLAECHVGVGDRASAYAIGSEALELCRRRNHRLLECRVLLVLGALKADEAYSVESEDLLARATNLIESTGARSYLPLLEKVRGGSFSKTPATLATNASAA